MLNANTLDNMPAGSQMNELIQKWIVNEGRESFTLVRRWSELLEAAFELGKMVDGNELGNFTLAYWDTDKWRASIASYSDDRYSGYGNTIPLAICRMAWKSVFESPDGFERMAKRLAPDRCGNCANWERQDETRGKCKIENLISGRYFSCPSFKERGYDNGTARQNPE